MYNLENPETSTKIKLQKGLGIMRKRKQQAILHTRRYKLHTEPDKNCQADKSNMWPIKPVMDMQSKEPAMQSDFKKKHVPLYKDKKCQNIKISV